ncbi:hypothetical protein L596_015330 [Steinernema carpocapsae]|uniref:Saposin B-type domain-containing protein n=1 Tax=Steinernema carpocapsae TaxID=34508 RepID=A0A4U5NFJ7_STECR|nr:hypothetical protein L596_015330 [Steinernema carpocapsae]
MKTFVLIALALIGFCVFAQAGQFCDSCKDIVKKAEDAGDYSDTWLKEHIPGICGALGPLEKTCAEALNKISQKLDEAVKNKEDPFKACESVKLC